MAVLSYNEILPKIIIVYNDEPYEVLSSHIFRMQMRKPVNQTRLRQLIGGKVIEVSFHQNETVKEADVDTMKGRYLYTNRDESWFDEADNPRNRFSFPKEAVHGEVQWLPSNSPVEILRYEEKPVAVKIPIKVDLEVRDAPPAVRGNTVSGGTKIAELVTGARVNVPLFINPGDIVRINTDTGLYTERVTKA